MGFFTNTSVVNGIDKKDVEVINVDLSGQSAQTLNYYVDMHSFSSVSFFYDIGGTGPITLTVEASNDEVAQGSADYLDVTNDLFGAASYMADAFKFSTVPVTCKWLKFKVVVGGAGSDNSIKLVVRKGYR